MANIVNASQIALTKYQSIISSKFSYKSLENEVFGNTKRRVFLAPPLALKKLNCEDIVDVKIVELVKEEENEVEKKSFTNEAFLYSFNPLSSMFVAALPGAGAISSLFGWYIKLVKSWNPPDWLVHWGHPVNMAIVLFVMGSYGTYLGFRIRFSNDVEEKAKAKDMHPKVQGGMFFFFAFGAIGGIVAMLNPIFESPHAITGFIGLTLLTLQAILPTQFEGNPGLRNVHGILGSGIMALFLVHAALGLQLGLSY